MLRMRRITDQAFIVLAEMLREPRTVTTARSLSEATGIPPATTAKLLKVLQRNQLLTSTRGAEGGYSIACNPSETSILTVIEAFEGPLGLTECSLPGLIGCDTHDTCQLGPRWPAISGAVREALRSVTLLDLVYGSTPAIRPSHVHRSTAHG